MALSNYTKAKEKLAAIFNQAPWLKTDGKAVHLPISKMPEGHQLMWPELYALYRESDNFNVQRRMFDVVEERIDAAPVDGISADGSFSEHVHAVQRAYRDGLRAGRLATIRAFDGHR